MGPPFTVAEGDGAVFSGRVVDEKGDAVEGLLLAILPEEIGGPETPASYEALVGQTGRRGHFM